MSTLTSDELHHYGDPCVHCAIPHDDVPPGPCEGDPSKAVPMAWRSLGVRYDNVEHFLIQMSNGEFTHRWSHINNALPWNYLKNARFDSTLSPVKRSTCLRHPESGQGYRNQPCTCPEPTP